VTGPRDLRELVGDEVSEEELERLRPVDALLRSVPAPPPAMPQSLTRTVLQRVHPSAGAWSRGRLSGALALAASLALVFFAVGTRVGSEGFDERATVAMEATGAARGASAVLRIGERDASGNWRLRLEARNLPKLPAGGYYVLWLAKDGDYGGTCGTFAARGGEAEAEWTVSYRLSEYDAWVVTAHRPDQPADAEAPWLLEADVKT
jgi:Anti-sigma-K factor rskA